MWQNSFWVYLLLFSAVCLRYQLFVYIFVGMVFTSNWVFWDKIWVLPECVVQLLVISLPRTYAQCLKMTQKVSFLSFLQMNYRGKNLCHFYQFWCENWSKNLTWPEYETFFKQYDTVLHMCSPVLKSTSTCLRIIGRKFRKNRIKGWTSILKSSHSTWCFDGWKDCFEQNRIFLSQTIDRTEHFL